MSKNKLIKNKTTNKKWDVALKEIAEGNSFGVIHKKHNISIIDWKNKAIGDKSFKDKLAKAIASFRQYWLQRILEESYDSNQREVLVKVFEEHLNEIEEIRTHVLETVEEIVIHIVDHTNVKKKIQRLN